jgi:hypothetical protein
MMTKNRSTLAKILERVFSKTMHRYWFRARSAGVIAGQSIVLMLLYKEQKRLIKEQEVAVLRAEARRKAKYLGGLIQQIKAEIRDVD